MKFINSKNIPKWVMFLPIIAILLTSLFINMVTILSIQNNFKKEKTIITNEFMKNLKDITTKRVDLTYNIIDAIYKMNKDKPDGYKKTIFMMQKILDKMRWGKKGYIFVFDYKGNTLFHINKYYMLINRWNYERNGVKVIRKIIQTSLKHPDGTYVKYLAYNPDGDPIEKESYVKIYKPLKIIIGNGVYFNYLDERLLRKQQQQEKLLKDIIQKIAFISIVISLFMIIVMYLLSLRVKSILEKYNTQLKQEKHKLFIQANFDTLTGLDNREHFLLELKEALSKIDRTKMKLAILFIDIDHFKEINDSKGHHIGDKVLKIIAKRLKNILREGDVVARFGGDEFVVLLDNIIDDNSIAELTHRILKVLKQPMELENINHYVSGSIGISIAPDDSKDMAQLIKFADTAMYRSKQQGKDRFNFYNSSMTKDANQRLAIKSSLHNALKHKEFEIYFQPQIDRNNHLYGAEILIRWNHPEKGIISPLHFIPLAIELGIIDKIDLWVIENGIIQYKKWEEKGFKIGVISCNITIYQLEKGNLYNDLKKLLEKYSFDPKNLNIEVTEEGIMKNPKKSIEILNKIRDLGIKINIDDFGTGYSSLTYLKKLPISKLKIDRNFIKDIPEDKDDMVITKTIISLAKNLNLKLIAEGVETEKQQEFIFQNGCEYIQGYLYSKPLPIDKFENKFLKKGY